MILVRCLQVVEAGKRGQISFASGRQDLTAGVLGSVARLQRSLQNSGPELRITLRTRGGLSFPLPLTHPGTATSTNAAALPVLLIYFSRLLESAL